MIGELLDKVVAVFDPRKGLKRSSDRKILQVMNSGYSHHGASRIKKSLLGWLSSGKSPDDDITDNLELMRERCRDLFMGAPLATGALKTLRTNVVGTGIRPKAKLDSTFLGISQEEAESWESAAEREFNLFAARCDVRRKMDFYEMQALIILAENMSGEVFITLPMLQRMGDTYALKINLIEADRIKTPPTQTENLLIRGGIEDDEYGCPVAYYISKVHPKDRYAGNVEYEKILAFGEKTGRRNILHIMETERPGQRRGVPLLAPVIEQLKQLTRFSEAELMNCVVSAMMTIFITSENPSEAFEENLPEEMKVDSADQDSIEMGYGNIVNLAPGEKISMANSNRPSVNFDTFVLSIARQVGTATDIPVEILTKHFTASYSASRAALMEFWKSVRMRRNWLISQFCQPVYEEFITEAVARGRLQAPGFFSDPAIRAAWCGTEWYGTAQGQIDPLKEAKAAVVRIDNCLSTRTKEAAEISGGDFEYIVKERSKEEKRIKEGGIIIEGQVLAVPSLEPDDEPAESTDGENS